MGAQEAVSNGMKHGRARNVDITLKSTANETQLIVSDDGCGLPQPTLAVRGGPRTPLGGQHQRSGARKVTSEGKEPDCGLCVIGPG